MIAAEIMTRHPETIELTASVAAAVDRLEAMRVRHLPVVDEMGTLVGVVSDRDLGPLMRTFIETAEVDEMTVPPAERIIADYMSTGPVTVAEDADIAEVIDTLVEERIGAIPVVDGADRVVGIISYIDVLNALRPEEPASRRGAPTTRSPSSGPV